MQVIEFKGQGPQTAVWPWMREGFECVKYVCGSLGLSLNNLHTLKPTKQPATEEKNDTFEVSLTLDTEEQNDTFTIHNYTRFEIDPDFKIIKWEYVGKKEKWVEH